MLDILILEAKGSAMANPKYSVLVLPYLFGQFRIQITDTEIPDKYAVPGHGAILREMCTYNVDKMLDVVDSITNAADPLGLIKSLETPRNCEWPSGRIRLDNEPEVWTDKK